VLDLRLDHGPQRVLLQVLELRYDERVRISNGRRSTVAGRRSGSM